MAILPFALAPSADTLPNLPDVAVGNPFDDATLWAFAAVFIGGQVIAVAWAVARETRAGKAWRARRLTRRLNKAGAARARSRAHRPVLFYPDPTPENPWPAGAQSASELAGRAQAEAVAEVPADLWGIVPADTSIAVASPTPAPRVTESVAPVASGWVAGWEFTAGELVAYPRPCAVVLVDGYASDGGGQREVSHYLVDLSQPWPADLVEEVAEARALEAERVAWRWVHRGVASVPGMVEVMPLLVACQHVSCVECDELFECEDGPGHLDPRTAAENLRLSGWRQTEGLWACPECVYAQGDEPPAPAEAGPGQIELPVLEVSPVAVLAGRLAAALESGVARQVGGAL